MNLRDRIGIDVGRKLPLEDAVEWAAEHRVRYIDIQLDTGDNALGTIDGAVRGARVRALCERHGVPSRAPYLLGGQRRRIRALCRRCGRGLPQGLCRCRGAARRQMDRHACRVSFHLRQGAAHDRPGASGCKRVIAYAENKGALDPPRKPQQGAGRRRDALPRPYGRGVALLFRRRSNRRRSGCRSPPTTRISCPKASRVLSMRSICAGSRRCGSPIASATATKRI